MPLTPYNESPSVRIQATATSGTNTSEIDNFRQGVELITNRHRFAGTVRISEGSENHQIKQSSFGLAKTFVDEGTAYEDQDRYTALSYMSDTLNLPNVMSNSNLASPYQLDGIIEIMPIRSVVSFNSQYSPFEFRSVKGSVMGGNTSEVRGDDLIVNEFKFAGEIGKSPFLESGWTLNNTSSILGDEGSEVREVNPFNDGYLTKKPQGIGLERRVGISRVKQWDQRIDLISGKILWLKSDVGLSLNGNSILIWYDQSGAGNHAYRNGDVNDAIWSVSSGINGYPGVSFEDSSALMITAMAETSNDYTVIAAVYANATPKEQTIISSADPSLPDVSLFVVGDTTRIINNYVGTLGAEWQPTAGNVAGVATGNQIVTWVLDSSVSTVKIYRDSKLIDDGTNTTYTNRAFGQNVVLGAETAAIPGNQHFGGIMSEVLMFNRVLTDSELSDVHGYMTEKYNMQFDPITSISGSLVRFRADSGVSKGPANTSWTDSISGLVLNQTASAEPVLHSPDFGRPYFHFNGAQRFFSVSPGLNIARLFGDRNFSLFIIANDESAASGRGWTGGLFSTSVVDDDIFFSVNMDSIDFGKTDELLAFTAARGLTVRHLLYNGTALVYRENKNIRDSALTGSHPLADTNTIYVGSGLNELKHHIGRIYEILIYESKLTDAEIDTIESYLIDYYTTSSLPKVINEIGDDQMNSVIANMQCTPSGTDQGMLYFDEKSATCGFEYAAASTKYVVATTSSDDRTISPFSQGTDSIAFGGLLQ